MHRRLVLAGLAAAAAAAPRLALADPPRMSLDRAFPYLSAYLGLPPAARSRFYLAYHAVRDNRAAFDARATIVAANGARAPLPIGPGGQVARTPTLAELKSGAQLELDSAPFKLMPELRSTLGLGVHIDAGELAAGLAQINADVAHFAGALSLIAPKFTTAYFPDAGGGQALLADGRAVPLPLYKSPIIGVLPYFEPASFPGARGVELAHPPSRIILNPHPRGV